MTNDEPYHAIVEELRRREKNRRELEESFNSRKVKPAEKEE